MNLIHELLLLLILLYLYSSSLVRYVFYSADLISAMYFPYFHLMVYM